MFCFTGNCDATFSIFLPPRILSIQAPHSSVDPDDFSSALRRHYLCVRRHRRRAASLKAPHEGPLGGARQRRGAVGERRQERQGGAVARAALHRQGALEITKIEF